MMNISDKAMNQIYSPLYRKMLVHSPLYGEIIPNLETINTAASISKLWIDCTLT
jgi:hypothetical protein